jgi:voltage-gated potassium channel
MLFTIVLIVLFFGTVIHWIERATFPTIFDGVYWSVITASTVGYGDLYPHTLAGKWVGILLIIIGAGFITTYFAFISKSAIAFQDSFQKGDQTFNGQDHLIIFGWNERSRIVIDSLILNNPPVSIVLIDESLHKNPYNHGCITYIKGCGACDDPLIRANVHKARKAIITADPNFPEREADMRSILTLLALKGLNPELVCTIEILTTEQLNNAKRAGADHIISSNEETGQKMLRKWE